MHLALHSVCLSHVWLRHRLLLRSNPFNRNKQTPVKSSLGGDFHLFVPFVHLGFIAAPPTAIFQFPSHNIFLLAMLKICSFSQFICKSTNNPWIFATFAIKIARTGCILAKFRVFLRSICTVLVVGFENY